MWKMSIETLFHVKRFLIIGGISPQNRFFGQNFKIPRKIQFQPNNDLSIINYHQYIVQKYFIAAIVLLNIYFHFLAEFHDQRILFCKRSFYWFDDILTWFLFVPWIFFSQVLLHYKPKSPFNINFILGAKFSGFYFLQ